MGNQVSQPIQLYKKAEFEPPSIPRNADRKKECEQDVMRKMAYEDAMSKVNSSDTSSN